MDGSVGRFAGEFNNETGEESGDFRRDRTLARIKLMNSACADPRVSGSGFKFLWTVGQNENQRLSQTLLGALIGGIKSRMQTYLAKNLQDLGYIVIDRGRGFNVPSRYRLNYTQSVAASAHKPASTSRNSLHENPQGVADRSS